METDPIETAPEEAAASQETAATEQTPATEKSAASEEAAATEESAAPEETAATKGTAATETGGEQISLNETVREIEALLFLSTHAVSEIDLAEACQVDVDHIADAVEQLEKDLEPGRRGLLLRRVADGLTLATDPATEAAARRLLAKPRTPPLTQAQAETLAIVAYLQPVSRPEIARIRGVSSESAVSSLSERGLIEESGRSRFGAMIYRTSALFEKVFGLEGLDALPDPTRFDPTPEDERDLRERLLAAGEQRAEP